ncbi:YncE family protein [Albibacterium profundi]|uniref:TolB-like 6-blade propeller-like n=1 Tax=Albibacterium profundi TaxID=3134906 RepID=A0ABV5CDJ3_9SPHI
MRDYRLFFLFIALGLGFLVSCERNDDEPVLPQTPISRLYVSFSDVQSSDLEEPYRNIEVFDPVHETPIPMPVRYNSEVEEGAGIFFDPFSSRIFQGSLRNQTIKTFSVNAQGSIGTGVSFSDSTLLSQRDLAYDHSSKYLYVSDNLAGSIYGYAQALTNNGQVPPNKIFALGGAPWGVYFQGDTLAGDSLFITMAGQLKEVWLLDAPHSIDSGQVDASKKISITGAADLRGIAFSSKLNLLVLSDFSNNSIYVIENAREAFNSEGAVSPTRIIVGAETLLDGPIDVAIDDRDERNLLYVISRNNKKLLRYPLASEGNIAPEASHNFTLEPVSIYLDAR